jgi:hypothetical protein
MITETKTHAEFSDYPLADLPPIPDGFADSSWHNDTCPSYINEAIGVQVFIDYVDVSKRELPEGKRFTVSDADTYETLLQTDDWNAVLHRIADVEGETK